ncbi:MAG: (4Fe-4S)-binding protein [Agriterribacter sp.]
MQYKLKQPITGTIGTEKYACKVQWRNGTFIADEPENIGGKDTGPDPHSLLLSSLAVCTLVTLRMYIDRKQWNVPEIMVKANMFQTKTGETVNYFIDRDIHFPGAELDTEQKNRLVEIAGNCPISKILEGNTKVRTYAYHDEPVAKKIDYKNEQVTVEWKPDLCKHSGRCVNQLPEVFNVKAHPWINVNGADAEIIRAQVAKCPTGALSIADK